MVWACRPARKAMTGRHRMTIRQRARQLSTLAIAAGIAAATFITPTALADRAETGGPPGGDAGLGRLPGGHGPDQSTVDVRDPRRAARLRRSRRQDHRDHDLQAAQPESRPAARHPAHQPGRSGRIGSLAAGRHSGPRRSGRPAGQLRHHRDGSARCRPLHPGQLRLHHRSGVPVQHPAVGGRQRSGRADRQGGQGGRRAMRGGRHQGAAAAPVVGQHRPGHGPDQARAR